MSRGRRTPRPAGCGLEALSMTREAQEIPGRAEAEDSESLGVALSREQRSPRRLRARNICLCSYPASGMSSLQGLRQVTEPAK